MRASLRADFTPAFSMGFLTKTETGSGEKVLFVTEFVVKTI
jgi:hypothetical protein